MNRRGFLYRLAGLVLGAPLVAKLGAELPAVLAPVERAAVGSLDAMLFAEAHRIRSEVARRIARSSPFIDLLTPGTFPEGLGNPVRLTQNPQTHATRIS